MRARVIERFLHVETASGIVLLLATIAALLWASSPWHASYDAFKETSLGNVTVEGFVNDVLMAIFFFVVGLEIKRELHGGQLSDARRAALPVIAALGGMVVPALIYLAFNRGELARGWGVPMATDIAFAVGVLGLLGERVPRTMRVFLLALAIIDDIGAIIVIALFYSSGIGIAWLVVAAAGGVAIVALQRAGTRHPIVYGIPAIVVWVGVQRAGIHPAIAGVIVGLLTPAIAWYPPALGELASPAHRIEHALHPWVAFAIMPLFALVNAGVDLSGPHVTAAPTAAAGIAAGLVAGKPIGILAASWLAVRLRIASLPRGLTWRGVAVVGLVAGIGFTMALFVADLAFAERVELHRIAKIAVLLASTVAAVLALVLGRTTLARSRVEPARHAAAVPQQ